MDPDNLMQGFDGIADAHQGPYQTLLATAVKAFLAKAREAETSGRIHPTVMAVRR